MLAIYSPKLISPFNVCLLNDLPQGYTTCFAQGPESLSWAGLLAAHVKITLSGIPNILNYCIIFIVCVYNFEIWPWGLEGGGANCVQSPW
jgi:hypothetical protein